MGKLIWLQMLDLFFFLMSILGLGFGGAMLMGHLMYNSGSLGSRQLLEIAACG